MNLWSLKKGQIAVLSGFDQKLTTDLKVRMQDIGFCEGETIECIRTPPFSGPKVFQVCGGVYSLAKEIAQSMNVEAIS